MSHFSINDVAKAVLASTVAFSASAAVVEPSELSALVAEARANGAAPVVVHLAPVSLQDLNDRAGVVKAVIGQRSERLLAELGANAWQAGRWENGAGQAGLYVTEAGLKLLQGSGNAVSFRRGGAWNERTRLDGSDGRHDEIERRLSRQGFVDVVVTLNVDELEYELGPDGEPRFHATARQADQARAKAGELFLGFSERQAAGKGAAVASLDALVDRAGRALEPQVTVRVDREGLVKLAESEHVRSVRPVGFKDKRPMRIDADVLGTARKEGSAHVIITVRNPLAGGRVTKETFAAQARSNKRTLDALLAEAGVGAKLNDLSALGAASGRLSLAELQALQAKGAGRILAIELNKPMGGFQLATSTATMNMGPAWNAGYRAANQNLVIVDSGVQSNHLFLRNASGASRVVFEACFGSNIVSNGVSYRSPCPIPAGVPPASWNGDGTLGQPGSAAPLLNCSSQAPASCHHGTHVAGIAAGRWYAGLPGGRQGVAPDAGIVAVQVSSYDVNRVAPAVPFTEDLMAAMNALVQAVTPNSPNNPYTVNLSVGSMGSTGTGWGSSCGSAHPAFTAAVQTLVGAGVPVVASTGNGNPGSNTSIAWPACIPGVIKVASVNNDGVGNTRSTFAHLANPANFPGERFWLGPGGGGGTVIVSSGIATNNGTFVGMAGTSQAAPHVAGLYAAIKAAVPGISVADASAWIDASATQVVPVNLCSQSSCPPGSVVNFKRIRLPNL